MGTNVWQIPSGENFHKHLESGVKYDGSQAHVMITTTFSTPGFYPVAYLLANIGVNAVFHPIVDKLFQCIF